MLVHLDPTDAGLNRHKRGLPPLELQIYELDLSPIFPSGILHFPLVALPGLILNHLSTIPISQIIPFTNQGMEPTTRLLPEFYLLSIALLTDFPPR
jgi:hypothetical protein